MIIFSFTLQGVIYLPDLCQVHYSPGLCLLERHLARVERRKLKMQKENLTRLLPLFENPKYMRVWVSWLDASLNPRCRVTQQYPYLYSSFFPPSNSVNLETRSRSLAEPQRKGEALGQGIDWGLSCTLTATRLSEGTCRHKVSACPGTCCR